MSAELLKLENEHIAFTLNADASAVVTDKTNHITWRMRSVAIQEHGEIDEGHGWQRCGRSVCEQYPGRFEGRGEGDGVRFVLRDQLDNEKGSFHVDYRLDGDALTVEIPDIDKALPSLVFPPPFEVDELLLPRWAGRRTGELEEKFERNVYRFAGYGLNMRWIGGMRSGGGWICIVEQGHQDAGILHAGAGAAPAWLKSLGQWNTPRKLRYQFFKGGYVQAAKRFRAWAQNNGLFKTLREKIDDVPAVGNLVGGRMVGMMMGRTIKRERFEDLWVDAPEEFAEAPDGFNCLLNCKQAARIQREARELGMKKGMFKYAGWILGGYDETHPDIWPPDPGIGSPDEFKALCAPDENINVCLHDNYQDIYQQSASFPDGVNRLKDGSLMTAGIWSGGQAYILNSRNALASAVRNWEKLKTLGFNAMYSDTMTAEIMRQSWEEGNRLTRTEDEEYKRQIMQFFKDQGLMFSSEDGCDYGIPWCDRFPQSKFGRTPGETVPLWMLVYHDCHVGVRHVSVPRANAKMRASSRQQLLMNMLWGHANIFAVQSMEDWERNKSLFRDSYFVDEWHEQIALDEMTDHKVLSEDGQVEQTVFSSGRSIIVNFSEEEREADGCTIPAEDYILLD